MKKIIASAGLVALGIVGAKANGVAVTGPAEKPWSVSASLRGFYDDNYTLANASSNKLTSFGFEVNPKVGVNLNGEQTSFGAEYAYTLKYYTERSDKKIDHTHQFSIRLNHAFTERYSLNVRDEFVYSQEPTLTDPNLGTVGQTGNAFHNTGQINFHAQATRLLEIVLGYQNELYRYEDSAYSNPLNRLEHYANFDLNWQVTPQTIASLGYVFSMVNYDKMAAALEKDNNGHLVTLGLSHNFSPDLSGSVKVGAQFTDYRKAALSDTLSPYANLSLRYTYQPDSYLEAGFVHNRSQDSFALDREYSELYATLSHSFTPKFVGKLTGRAQYGDLHDGFGSPPPKTEWIYLVDAGLAYHFTPYLSANVDYYFDAAHYNVSDLGYDRNRVFLGITAKY